MVVHDDGGSLECDLEETRWTLASSVAQQRCPRVQAKLAGDLLGLVGPGGVHVPAAVEVRADRNEPFCQLGSIDQRFVRVFSSRNDGGTATG